MAIGFAVNLIYDAGEWTPEVMVSNSDSLTPAADGDPVDLPWVENSNSGTADTSTFNLKTAVAACSAAMFNWLAENDAPT